MPALPRTRPRRLIVAAVAALASAGCSDETIGAPAGVDGGSPSTCAAGERAVDGKGCVAAGVQDDGCPAATLAGEAGSCVPAGVPAALCAEGFEAAAEGCAPILPADPCGDGEMALPGETECHRVAACGSEPWGDVPVEAGTQYVDPGYQGGDSDGSADKPWTALGEAIAAAAPGAIVAIAAGVYVENVVLEGKAVRLWGRCPDVVELTSLSAEPSVRISDGASGSAVRGVAVTGLSVGVFVSGAEDVVIDSSWIHDTADRALDFEAETGATSVTVTRTLVERSSRTGVLAIGAALTMEGVVVRDTRPDSDGSFGRGVTVQGHVASQRRGTAALRASIVERNRDVGVYLTQADASLEAMVVRDTLPEDANDSGGRGVSIEDNPDFPEPAAVTVVSSTVERNRDIGVFVSGGELTMEGSVVRDTEARLDDSTGGRGVAVQDHGETGRRARATVRASLVERSHEVGLRIAGSDATVEGTIVRETLASADGTNGRGMTIEPSDGSGDAAIVTLRGSSIDDSRDIGLAVVASEARVEGTSIHATAPRDADGTFGRGISIQSGAELTLVASVVDGGYEAGVCVLDSEATVVGSVVRGIRALPSSHAFGDGIAVEGSSSSRIDVTGSRVEESERAGISAFGGAVTLGTTVLECNAIHLDGEPSGQVDPSFVDSGTNVCGCEGATSPCRLVSSQLEPPPPLE